MTDCVSFHLMREHGINRALAYDIHFEWGSPLREAV